jgi:hypothetical protein
MEFYSADIEMFMSGSDTLYIKSGNVSSSDTRNAFEFPARWHAQSIAGSKSKSLFRKDLRSIDDVTTGSSVP